MRSKKPFSAGKPTFVIFIVLLLASAIVPTQAQAQKFKVLHTFHGKDGANPNGTFVRDAHGNLIGATSNGGTGSCPRGPGCGTVFKMSTSGKILWSHSLKSYRDGFEPDYGVFQDAAGNLYGTTVYGGIIPCYEGDTLGCGTVFKFDTAGRETVLHRFRGPFNGYHDGWAAESLPVGDSAGNVYGTTLWGGAGGPTGGTVFKVTQAGKETVLHSFPGPSGQNSPWPGLLLRPDKSFYSGAGGGGTYGAGVAFSMTTRGNETVLYNFSGGAYPGGGGTILTADAAGNLYGANGGGSSNCGMGGCGTLFELSPDGGSWTEKTLYVFCQAGGCKDGEFPGAGPLAMDPAGNIYGTTVFGGSYPNCYNGGTCGVVFRLDTAGDETVLHSFSGGSDGTFPLGVIMDAKGNLYGATGQGGDLNCPGSNGHGCGVIFEITP
jgi:uncharacterized repeat protein (TIGR03803 family)